VDRLVCPSEDVTVTDFLDEKRQQINDRLKELKPLVEEFNRLEAAAIALAGALGSAASEAAGAVVRRRGPGRPRGSASRRAATATAPKEPEAKVATAEPAKATAPKAKARRKRRAGARTGRRKGSGTRAAEALSLVQGQPGITIPELAAKMGINQNYLYRVLPGLEKEGKVRKEGRGWSAKAS
jgi:ABC-type transporter Mla subunit MlaD